MGGSRVVVHAKIDVKGRGGWLKTENESELLRGFVLGD
jgi:hypothetical protein